MTRAVGKVRTAAAWRQLATPCNKSVNIEVTDYRGPSPGSWATPVNTTGSGPARAITIRHRRSSTSGACPPPESPGPLTEKTYGLQNAGLSDKTVLSTTNREDVKHLAGSTIKVGDDWRATMILRRRLGEMEFVNEPNYLEFAMYRPHPVI